MPVGHRCLWHLGNVINERDTSIRIVSSGTSLKAWTCWGRGLKNLLRAQSRGALGRSNIFFSTTNIKNPSKKPVLKLFAFLLKACFALNLKSLVIFEIVYFEIFFPSLPCDDITSSH